ncbi:hypothetical protein HZC21_03935 [Candidatus Peregrinibacteria bacterium]|nr:hypothetical protein [Candidatus Peregrinibacteria bacterium]
MNKHSLNVRKVKHFLLGAGLALTITFAASSAFAQQFGPNPQTTFMKCLSLGGKTVTIAECQAADKAAGGAPTGGANLPTCAVGQSPAPGAECIPSGSSGSTQQSAQQNSQPSQQATTPTQSETGQPEQDTGDADIADLKKMIEEMKKEKAQEQAQKKEELLKMLKEAAQQKQQPLFGQQEFEQQEFEKEVPAADKKVDKSKLSSVKNPAAVLAKKSLKNIDKLLNTLSKKFNKAKTKTKKIAVARSVAKQFMNLCKKYASAAAAADDEEFDDEESFTCDEFVADLSEPIAAALKSKDADLAFELTYDALNVNFKELFNLLIQ